MWKSTSCEQGWDGWYNIWRSKSKYIRECGIGIDDIMCDDITCEDPRLLSMVGMDNITCDNLTYDDLSPDVCQNVVLGLMI